MTPTETTRAGAAKSNAKAPMLYDPKVRGILYQVGVLAMVGLLAYYLMSNTLANLERQNIATGLGFLEKQASFEIGESLISYSAADTYFKALLVGALNTLLVSFIGIVLTVILGTVIGIARLSTNWLVSRLAAIYIEVFQDIPILLQLFFWYAFFYEMLPGPRQALNLLNGVYLCNRGLIFGIPAGHPAYAYMGLAFVAGIVAVYVLKRWARARQARTGKAFPTFKVGLAVLLGLPLLVWWLAGADPLGPASAIRMSISQSLPGVDWSDPTWGIYDGDEFSIEFNTGDEDPINSIMLHVRGGGDAIAAMLQFANPNKWSLLDFSTGEFLDPENPSQKAWEDFQAFHDKMLDQQRNENIT